MRGPNPHGENSGDLCRLKPKRGTSSLFCGFEPRWSDASVMSSQLAGLLFNEIQGLSVSR
jgi:hypothetical protein